MRRVFRLISKFVTGIGITLMIFSVAMPIITGSVILAWLGQGVIQGGFIALIGLLGLWITKPREKSLGNGIIPPHM